MIKLLDYLIIIFLVLPAELSPGWLGHILRGGWDAEPGPQHGSWPGTEGRPICLWDQVSPAKCFSLRTNGGFGRI